MGSHNPNDALIAFGAKFHLNGDWLTCQGCHQSVVFSRCEERMYHPFTCRWDEVHYPWLVLRELIAAKGGA